MTKHLLRIDNRNVIVKLTEAGRSWFIDYLQSTNSVEATSLLPDDESPDGYNLLDVMAVFGPGMAENVELKPTLSGLFESIEVEIPTEAETHAGEKWIVIRPEFLTLYGTEFEVGIKLADDEVKFSIHWCGAKISPSCYRTLEDAKDMIRLRRKEFQEMNMCR